MQNKRGFQALVGARITFVNAHAINEVVVWDEEGNSFAIGAEAGPLGIPVITATQIGVGKK